MDYGLDIKFITAHIPIRNWKSCKMYENLNFLQKKIPHNLFGRSAQSAKIFGIFEKKLSLGVCSPCIMVSGTTALELIGKILAKLLGRVWELSTKSQKTQDLFVLLTFATKVLCIQCSAVDDWSCGTALIQNTYISGIYYIARLQKQHAVISWLEKQYFRLFPACFKITIIFSNLNSKV